MEKRSYFLTDEDLTCAICRDCNIEKDPRMLPCQPNFCFQCLIRLFRVSDGNLYPTLKKKSNCSSENLSKNN